MPVVLILLAAGPAPERAYPTMQACTAAAPAVARRRGAASSGRA
jgi:hypothetical protein